MQMFYQNNMNEKIIEFIKNPLGFVRSFVKWIAVGCVVGLISGIVGSLFRYAVMMAGVAYDTMWWIGYLLPIGGLAIVGLYKLCNMTGSIGTDRIIGSVRAESQIPVRLGPLIFISTVITHLLGGSAGREGAALQLGGSIGTQVGRLFRLDEKDMSLVVLAGMSGVFSALFGTPLTAVFFALEVISVGVIYYAGLIPCLVASLTAFGLSDLFGFGREIHMALALPQLHLAAVGKVAVLGLCCALLSIFYIFIMDSIDGLFEKYFENPFLRILCGGIILVAMSAVFSSRNYNGAGMDVIFRALSGSSEWYDCLLKILFTAVTIGCGFKGGEIVPTFFIGATMGCFVGGLIGLDPGFAADLGLVATFCAVVNSPVASILMGVEMFGAEGLIYFAVACSISYMMSGYYGLYGSQKIMYSKTKAEFININAK